MQVSTGVYFTAKELHVRPVPIGKVMQEEEGRIYPNSTTRLMIHVDEHGKVDHAEIMSTSNEALAKEALLAFAKASYVPGAIAGRWVKSELVIVVTSTANLGLQIKPWY